MSKVTISPSDREARRDDVQREGPISPLWTATTPCSWRKRGLTPEQISNTANNIFQYNNSLNPTCMVQEKLKNINAYSQNLRRRILFVSKHRSKREASTGTKLTTYPSSPSPPIKYSTRRWQSSTCMEQYPSSMEAQQTLKVLRDWETSEQRSVVIQSQRGS